MRHYTPPRNGSTNRLPAPIASRGDFAGQLAHPANELPPGLALDRVDPVEQRAGPDLLVHEDGHAGGRGLCSQPRVRRAVAVRDRPLGISIQPDPLLAESREQFIKTLLSGRTGRNFLCA